MPVSKPVIGRYSKQTALQQLNNLAAKDYSAQKEETSTGRTTYEIWQARLRETLQWRQNKYDTDWKRAYSMFNGAHWEDSDENNPSSSNPRNKITVNVTMSNVLNIVPFLLNKNPQFKCKPRKPEDVESAKLQEAILNYEYEQREMDVQVKSAVYDDVTIGHGIIKTGYTFEIDIPTNKKDGAVLDYEAYITKDSPFVKRVCPFFFLIDPSASENSLESARWCAEIFFKSSRQVLANPRYNQAVLQELRQGLHAPGTKQTVFDSLSDASLSSLVRNEDRKNPDGELWVLYEVWDKAYKKYYIFLDGVAKPLVEKDWPYEYLDNFPFIKTDYIPIQDELYGVGIPYTIEDQQFELNRIRTYALQHRRRFNRKYLALKGKVDPTEANKLVEGPDGTIVFVDMMDVVKPLEDAPMSQDQMIAEGMVKEDIKNTVGSDALVQGGNLPSRTTGVEVNTRANLYRLKLDDRVEAVDRFVRRIGAQVLQHIKQNYRKERVFEVLGLAGIIWEQKKLSLQQIKDEVDVSMETVSAPKVDPSVDRQQRSVVWQTSVQAFPLVQAGLLKINYNALFAWLMESFGYKDVGKFFDFALVVQPQLQQTQGQQQSQVISQSPEPSAIAQQNGTQSIMGLLNGLNGLNGGV